MSSNAPGGRSDFSEDAVSRLTYRLAAKYRARIAAQRVEPARPASWRDFPSDLSPQLVHALRARRLSQLYSHQRAAWDLARAHRHLVVATPTASGKTLCYNLPVLQSVLSEGGKALYLFPTSNSRRTDRKPLI
ncbi:hypothetical protein CKO27_16020 [Thiocystis violacea]|nr:hypothetical protein [Thiocystis violacea]